MKLGNIGYINVLPVTLGIESGQVPFSGQLVQAEPSELNRLTRLGLLDITAVSSIEYVSCARDYRLVQGVALSSPGAVQSVKLFSLFPVEELAGRKVAVTRASATSRALLQILLPAIEVEDLPSAFDGTLTPQCPAVLLIGDQALTGAPLAPFQLDLGQAWRDRTGLPMVFAVWLARRSGSSDAEGLLRASRDWGLLHAQEVIAEAARRTGWAAEPLQGYFAGLRYHLGPCELESLELFYRLARERGLISSLPPSQDLRLEERVWSA